MHSWCKEMCRVETPKYALTNHACSIKSLFFFCDLSFNSSWGHKIFLPQLKNISMIFFSKWHRHVFKSFSALHYAFTFFTALLGHQIACNRIILIVFRPFQLIKLFFVCVCVWCVMRVVHYTELEIPFTFHLFAFGLNRLGWLLSDVTTVSACATKLLDHPLILTHFFPHRSCRPVLRHGR